MPSVFIPAQLRDLTGGHAQVEVAAATVGEAIEALDRRFPGMQARLCRDGVLLPGLQVSVDGTMTTRGLRAKLAKQSELHFLPALGGG